MPRLVHIDHWVKATVFGVSPVSKVLIGKSGWLYFRGEDSKAFDRWYRGGETVPDATLIAARDELLRRQAFLAGRGIPFMVVVVPEKYSVYPEHLPDWSTRIAQQTPLDRFAADLARYPQLEFIDLRGPLMDAKGSDRLYYQTDSHWNYLGATVGYKALMAKVEQALPGLTVAPVTRPPYVAETDFYSGDLAQMLGLRAPVPRGRTSRRSARSSRRPKAGARSLTPRRTRPMPRPMCTAARTRRGSPHSCIAIRWRYP